MPEWETKQITRPAASGACFDLRLYFGCGWKLLVRRSLVSDIELKHHVMFESLGLSLVSHCSNRRHATESRKKCPPVDFHSCLLMDPHPEYRISQR